MSAAVTARFAITHTPEGQHDPDQTDPPQPNASPEASSTTDLGGPRRSLARLLGCQRPAPICAGEREKGIRAGRRGGHASDHEIGRPLIGLQALDTCPLLPCRPNLAAP